MIKKIFTSLLALIIMLLPTFSFGAISLSESTSFLQGHYDSLDPVSQDWAAMALASVGTSVVVKRSNSTNTLDLARNILALKSQNIMADSEVALLESQYSGGQFGTTAAVNDDIFSILAIKASDPSWLGSHQEAFQAVIYNQKVNGSFDFSQTGSGNVDMTAAAIWALKNSSTASDSINKAMVYLSNSQNSDGGFPFLPGEGSNIASSSWALMAYQSLGQVSTRASNYLYNNMQNGGYWLSGGSTNYLNTSYALMALSGQSVPVSFKKSTVPVTTKPINPVTQSPAPINNSSNNNDIKKPADTIPTSTTLDKNVTDGTLHTKTTPTPKRKATTTAKSNVAANKSVCIASASAQASAGVENGSSYANSSASANIICQ